MREYTFRSDVMKGVAWAALVVLVLVLALHTSTHSVQAQEPKPTPTPGSERVPPPPGNCWNGALPGDPVFCYFLEEAQRAGEIEVAAVYKTPGGGRLYIYLRQTETVSDEVGAFFKEKAHEYLESAEGHGAYGAYECDGKTGEERTHCLNGLLGPPSPKWAGFDTQIGHSPLPQSRVYERIFLYAGGVEGRCTEWGWASWRQVWPSTGARSPDGAGSSTTFDVSDVDLTNIPEPDCEQDFWGPLNPSCYAWTQGPEEIGIAGVHQLNERQYAYQFLRVDPNYDVSTLRKQAYFQVASSIPDDETELEALKQTLAPGYASEGWDVELIQVNYDFGQLWRWKVILDRFALSAGNTVGITGGQIGMNNTGFDGLFGGEVWLNPGDPAGEDLADARNILIVWALDPERTATALPNLLPQLGIQADAVGLVGYDSATPLVPHPLTSDFTGIVVSDTASGGGNTGSDAVASAGTATEDTTEMSEAVINTESEGAPGLDATSSSGVNSDAVRLVASEGESKAEGIEAAGKDTEPLSSTEGVGTWVIAVSAGGALALAILGTTIFTFRRRQRHA